MKDYELGKIAYQAYLDSSGGKSLVSGEPIPGFWDQPERIRDAWQAAAEAVRDEVDLARFR